MTGNDARAGKVKTAETVFTIIELVASRSEVTVSDIASELGKANSTVSNHLTTLEELGYLVRDGREYRLSLRFLELGMVSRDEYATLRDVATNSLSQLAEATEEVVWLIVEEHGEAVFLDKFLGERAVPTYANVGKRVPMNQSAGGKAILAQKDPEEIAHIIDTHGLPGRTEHTLTDEEQLHEELTDVRRQDGIATNFEGTIPGVYAMAAPILVEDRVYGAVSISAPKSRMEQTGRQEQLREELRSAVNEISLKLTY